MIGNPKQIKPQARGGPGVRRHCPRCWARTLHVRTVVNGVESLACRECGNIQTYRIEAHVETD